MDFIVELPRSQGYDTILVVVDRLTKMAHFIATQGLPSAKGTAEVLVQEVVRLHGVPETITTDRGSQFTSKFWEALCKNLHIRRHLSTAFHPRTNGQTERTNQTLEQYLRCYIAQAQEEWRRYLPLAEFAFNNHVHRSTGLSPFYANYGYHPTMLPSSPIPSDSPGVEELLKELTGNFQLLKKTLTRAQESYKKYFDRRHSPSPKYQAGEKVWLSTANIRLALPSKKLGPRFIGPFKILEVISPTAMKLQLPDSYRIHPVFHVSLLRPVVPDRFLHRSLQSTPGPVMVDGEEEYEVQAIIDSRFYHGTLQYLVSWKGYGPEENSWLPATEVHAPALIREFHQRHPLKPSPTSTRPRRGRPRTLTATPAISDSAAPSTSSVPNLPVSERPRRGRPRTLTATPTTNDSAAPSASSVPNLPVAGRPRRGRPRKTPVTQ